MYLLGRGWNKLCVFRLLVEWNWFIHSGYGQQIVVLREKNERVVGRTKYVFQ